MNKEISCVTHDRKIGQENVDSDFLLALYSRYKKLFFHALLTNMFKQRYISSVASYKYLNKLISEK